jgi:hypothetical protein
MAIGYKNEKIGERRLKKNMFNFKKVASVLASAVMLSSTIGFAAAANYPSPFVKAGTADVAVVWGENAAMSDLTGAIDMQNDLGALVKFGGTETEATISGEAAAIFTGGTKLYINDSLNTVKSVLTKSNLPSVLGDSTFNGNVDSSMTQKINIGSNPKVTFKKQPTSTDDPDYSLTTSTTQANYIYNATVTFNKAVNFSHADSEGNDIELFGTTFTVGAASDFDTLVLLRSAEKLTLDSDNPTVDVSIEGSVYTVELVSTSDTAATVKITDSTGDYESKEINEAQSKTVQGVTVAVTAADETNIKLSATIIVGSNKLTLEDSSSVTSGEDDTIIDGTLVDFESGSVGACTKLTISVYAPEADLDALKPGETYTDPVFGTFKLDFAGFNIDSVDDDSRESISLQVNGDDKMDIAFTDHRGNAKTFQFVKNTTASLLLMGDDNHRNISVLEKERIQYQEYVVVGNEDEGYYLQLSAVKNASSGTSSDKVEFKDIFTGDIYKTSWTSDGAGTIDIGGKSYDVVLEGVHTDGTETFNVTLNYPDSSGAGVAVIYPTIETTEGAKVAFYEPKTINLTTWDGDGTDLGELKFPDGDGYTSVSSIIPSTGDTWNFTSGGTVYELNLSTTTNSTTHTVGQVKYNITSTGAVDEVKIYLLNVAETTNIIIPAVVVFEEKDDNSNYEAIIVELEAGATSDDGLGVDSVEDTWSNALGGWSSTRYSDSKQTDRGDLWGSIMTTDSADSDQKVATISYPDEQVYAQIYVAQDTASITPGVTTGGGGGQVLIVEDSMVSTVSSRNLVVVGGSCINSVAAKILGSDSPICTSDFTEKTGVGPSQYLIQVEKSPYTEDKIAMLVAGYESADTLNAVKKAKEGVSTDIGSKTVYPIAASE